MLDPFLLPPPAFTSPLLLFFISIFSPPPPLFNFIYLMCPPTTATYEYGCDHISTKLHLLFQKYTIKNFCLCVYLCSMRSWKQLNQKFHKFQKSINWFWAGFRLFFKEKKNITPPGPHRKTFFVSVKVFNPTLLAFGNLKRLYVAVMFHRTFSPFPPKAQSLLHISRPRHEFFPKKILPKIIHLKSKRFLGF